MASRRMFAGLVTIAGLLAFSTGSASAQTLGEEASYVLTFDPGADADAALVEISRSLPVVITHRFGSALEGAVVRSEAPPEAMLMVDGVATVDRDAVLELPDPEQPDPDEPNPDEPNPDEPDPELPDPDEPDPELPDPDEPDPELPDPDEPNPTLPDPTEPEPGRPDPGVGNVPWGIDRIDQRALPLSGSYTSPSPAGGVVVYVVDSGVSPHDQFGERLAPGLDLVGDGRGTTDCGGHGTHVAGTAAGSTLGVASGATIVPVRVFDCDGAGMTAQLLEALDWIATTHPAGRPGVVNYSGSMSTSSAGALAVQGLLNRGLTFVTAGGNENESACIGTGGTGVLGAVVVGATDATDARASWSNYGPCLDIFAPGQNIRSASNVTLDATIENDGTSFAAPHVAGAAAVLLGLNPSLSPAQVETLLLSSATPVVTNAGSESPNLLLYVDPAAVATATPPPPVAAAPAVPVEVEGTTAVPAQVREAVLALTGGDPRALLALGSALLAAGLIAVVAARRREEEAVMLASPGVVGPEPCRLTVTKRATP